MGALFEKYRPTTFDEVVGQELAVARLRMIERKFGFAGKSSLARIIAASVAKPIATNEVDAQDLTLDMIRDLERRCGFKPICGGIWAQIINEVHGLSSKVVSRLLST